MQRALMAPQVSPDSSEWVSLSKVWVVAVFLNRPLETCMHTEQHSHGEREAKFPCSDYARGVLAEHACGTCNFPLSVFMASPLWDLSGFQPLNWSVWKQFGLWFQMQQLENINWRSLSSDLKFQVLKGKKIVISNLHCGQQVNCRQEQLALTK